MELQDERFYRALLGHKSTSDHFLDKNVIVGGKIFFPLVSNLQQVCIDRVDHIGWSRVFRVFLS